MLSTLAVGYLFLGGSGAGACIIASIMALLIPRNALPVYNRHHFLYPHLQSLACATHIPFVYRRLLGPAYAIASGALVLGSFLLFLDLGDADRALLLFMYPTNSWLSIGAFALLITVVLALFLAVCWGLNRPVLPPSILRAIEVVCIASALIVALYTGLLLSTMGTVPLWNSPLIPLLFVLSSLSCGCALVVGCAVACASYELFKSVFSRLLRVDLAVIVLELIVAVSFVLLALTQSHYSAIQGVHSLLLGEMALPFIAGFLGCGIVLPAAMETGVLHFGIQRQGLVAMIAVLVLVGAFCMRYAIVFAAAHPAVWMGV